MASESPSAHACLIVDDEPALAELMALLVELKGCEARATSDPWEALAWIRDGYRPDLLVTDVHMPDVTGCDLAGMARADVPDLPLLFVSGRPDECGVGDGKWAPPCEFLPKPYSAEALHAALERLLRLASG